jgi:hypothetical protein
VDALQYSNGLQGHDGIPAKSLNRHKEKCNSTPSYTMQMLGLNYQLLPISAGWQTCQKRVVVKW